VGGWESVSVAASWADRNDVAQAALYLASDESRFVSASGLIVDGAVTGAK
jgi:hypothetical protein